MSVCFVYVALRRLTRKAELLGYTDPLGEVSGDSRKKIAPGLTVEFVNYFHGTFLTD